MQWGWQTPRILGGQEQQPKAQISAHALARESCIMTDCWRALIYLFNAVAFSRP